jgi:hypothetical protein
MRLTDTHPPLHRAGRAAWALASGITGIVADVLLVLDQLTENVGEVRQSFMWLPAAIAWVMVVQFLTLIAVALALRRWLPPTRSVRLATAVAGGAFSQSPSFNCCSSPVSWSLTCRCSWWWRHSCWSPPG